MKQELISAVISRFFDEAVKKKLAKDYRLSDEEAENVVRDVLDKLLISHDVIALLAEILEVYATGEKGDTKKASYIG